MSDRLRDEMRQERRASGLVWARFAREAGFSATYLRNIENGNRALTPEVARAYDGVLSTGGRFTRALHDPTPGTCGLVWERPESMAVLTGLLKGGHVDRREPLTVAQALSVSANSWARALESVPREPLDVPGGPGLLAHIGDRLDHLRHLDDKLGSGDVLHLARGELALIIKLIRSGRYNGATVTRLYAMASEASRQVGWAAFDQGKPGLAGRYFDGALRASAEANDPVGGAYAASFAAIQCYSTGPGDRAVNLLEVAHTQVRGRATPRMHAMLAARTARALSTTGAKRECARQIHLARTALDQGRREDDPEVLYWVDHGEIEMIAGSAALSLGDPAEALRRFEAAMAAAYPGDTEFPRSHAIYLVRAAEAHLALGDLDAAVATARHAARCLSSVDSVRSASELRGLREKLRAHTAYTAVRELLQSE
ncbi:helix-turn-helix transcriptional regulator [Nocardiopsis sp. B62]|uniref:helix-turn-helix domain-containing protein n=1 Tax=Nocardiopsis sp. B62 TaxID=2824874 RepID=UPI001B38BFDC|nr:helix-turn-helix transcriptional regulator [Nocardiopsis sp. B62]MBQ1082440.1 helix-turn-helix transcriptional regulator [Nocardiopsis sp. B62]